jgi:hypothetical protein
MKILESKVAIVTGAGSGGVEELHLAFTPSSAR